MTNYCTTTGAAIRDFEVCDYLSDIQHPTTSDMVIHSKISSGGTSATAGRSSRAESNQEEASYAGSVVGADRAFEFDNLEIDDQGRKEN